ncbi:LysR family transcriptional regulator [Burkholderia pyrrocinia]|uniref:LysR family transcriptional regulator n=1 Tax=Burkholderia pyrrocinia TaxID=60550 RepID=A0A2Z5N5Q5_BURPY|nr:LysR family transcriptional regulator [Burkholderia pyrrocinia]AXF24902.1 LysR family transcriptional regulator [Burkholderia pyrrocinia]
MNTRFLETFVTLAQQGSFRATARLLHTSPATISTRIKALEDELKTVLVDRTATDFRLTLSGETLLALAKNVVDAARALKQAAGLELELRGPIRFGVIDTIVHSWLSLYVTQLRERLPGLVVELTVDSSPALKKKILHGELDIAVCAEVVDSEKITSCKIASYPVRWIVSRELLSCPEADPVRLALERPVLTFGRGTTSHLAVERIVRTLASEVGIPDEAIRITCASSVAAIVQLVRDGYGVGAVPRLFVHDELENGHIAELALEPQPPSIDVSLCMSVNASPAVVAAADAARDVCVAYCSRRPGTLIRAA